MNQDFRDILCEFNAAKVEYLVVGAYALAAYGVPRATGDIDLWVRPSKENAQRIVLALSRFGGLVHGVTAADFEDPKLIFQMGRAPHRIDIITVIDGVTFDEAIQNARFGMYDGIRAPVIGKAEFVKNKRASGRPKDLADIATLELEGDDPVDQQ